MKTTFFTAALLFFCISIQLEGAVHLQVIPGNSNGHPVYETIQEALDNVTNGTQSAPSTITIHQGPVNVDGEWQHVLWDSKNPPAIQGSEEDRLFTKTTSKWVVIKLSLIHI